MKNEDGIYICVPIYVYKWLFFLNLKIILKGQLSWLFSHLSPHPCPSFCPLREIKFNVKNVRFLGNPICSLIKYINVFQVIYSKFNNYKKMRITKLFKITIAWVPGGHRAGKALPSA